MKYEEINFHSNVQYVVEYHFPLRLISRPLLNFKLLRQTILKSYTAKQKKTSTEIILPYDIICVNILFSCIFFNCIFIVLLFLNCMFYAFLLYFYFQLL